MKIVVFGGYGQLGLIFQELNLKEFDLLFFKRKHFETQNYDQIYKLIEIHKPQVIINFLAFTNVDQCEISKEKAIEANSIFPKHLSIAAKKHSSFLIHISTDYVFGDNSKQKLLEKTDTFPINFYGKSKRDGELNIIKSKCNYIILRTSWIYSDKKNNFFLTIKKLLESNKKVISVVNDQFGAPTSGYDFILSLKKILVSIKKNNSKNYQKKITGIYHLTNAGEGSWYNFACEISKNLGYDFSQRIASINSNKINRLAKRQTNSRLSNNKIKKVFNINLPKWENSLNIFCKEKFSMNTESIPEKFIDHLMLKDSVKLMLDDKLHAVKKLYGCINEIELIVNKIFDHLQSNSNSRLIYVGAGTSGRIAVQDGSELFPTFGWPKSRTEFIIAGGLKALTQSIENSEDDIKSAKKMSADKKISSSDIILAVSANGNTLFTNEVIKFSNSRKALTVGITNNHKTLLEKNSKLTLVVNTGAELVAGSTRLKAGTIQKIVLNIISTLVFVKLGCVEQGLMVNMRPSNCKLRKRKNLINKILS